MTKNRSSQNGSILNYISNGDLENKKKIEELKQSINRDLVRKKLKEKDFKFFNVLFKNSSENEIIKILDYFGKLPDNFPIKMFDYLLKTYQNENIKFLVVKNLGKTGNLDIVDILKPLLLKETNTVLRREIVSSIGRLRNESNLEILIESLKDDDPKVIMQGIRALLYFKDKQKVKDVLLPLKNHKNETIKEIISIELSEEKPESKQEKRERVEKY
ncbi:MAG: HEAT repeat domain-containing protein, partial [Candidatus Odinarchaeota archaeon]